MRKFRLQVLLLAVAVNLSFLTACSQNENIETTSNNTASVEEEENENFSKDNDLLLLAMNHSLDKMKTIPKTGHADIDYTLMMLPHHQGAIDMASLQLEYGNDPELKKMAQKLISASKQEITQMQSLINERTVYARANKTHQENLNDAFSNQILQVLDRNTPTGKISSTSDVDDNFASMMKQHHQQAVDMSRAIIEHGEDPEIKKLAQKIVTEQTKEIQNLDNWLRNKADTEA